MNEIPDILLFMRRVGPYHTEQLASLARHTQQSYNLICAYEPDTTAFECVNRAISRSTSRWMALVDDDVIFLEDFWLKTLIDILRQHDDLGVLTPMEVKTEEELSAFQKDRETFSPYRKLVLGETNWNPGYVLLFDREKVQDIYADEKLPGRYGMSDLDMCLQVRASGFRVAMTGQVYVYHPWKIKDREWRERYEMVQDDKEHEMHLLQQAHMIAKWGEFYLQNARGSATHLRPWKWRN